MEPTLSGPGSRDLTLDDRVLTLGDSRGILAGKPSLPRTGSRPLSFVRATVLTAFPELIRELGGDPAALFAQAGVPLEHVGDPDHFLPYAPQVWLKELAAADTGTPDLGLRLARRQGVRMLGPLSLAARGARTVGEGLALICEHLVVHSPAIFSEVVAESEDHVALTYEIVEPGVGARAQTEEHSLGAMHQMLRTMTDGRLVPVALHLPHAARSPLATYRTHCGLTPHFESGRTRVVFARAALDWPIRGGGALGTTMQDYFERLHREVQQPDRIAVTVRRIVERVLPTSDVDLATVAKALAMHPRTLQRRLAAEGESFGGIQESVRRAFVVRQLRDTEMPLDHLARLVGFSEQSSLTRASQRWFGHPPTVMRRQLRARAPRTSGPA